MNSIHRTGATVSVFVAVLTVAGALALRGSVAPSNVATATTAPSVLTDAPTDAPTDTPTPSLEPQTIYVMPPATPGQVAVKKAPPPAPPVVSKPQPQVTPPVIHVVVSSPPGGDDGGGGDD